jgi:hypothetical protein
MTSRAEPLASLKMGQRMVAGRRRYQGGVTYLWMLFLVFLLGLGLGKTLEIQSVASQRAREAQLLYVGGQYRDAIRAYYLAAPDGLARYPARLELLLKDSRFPGTKRHLRQLYLDPMTSKPFDVVMSLEGGIAGVRSLSLLRPIKRSGFSLQDGKFENAPDFRSWAFIYLGEPTSPVKRF